MNQKKGKSSQTIMDLLVESLVNADGSESLVDIGLSGNMKKIAAVPLRYRLIAQGIVKRLPLEEMNAKLAANGCAQLYARSLREAVIIYTLSNHLSYEEWKRLEKECLSVREEIHKSDSGLSSASISMEMIRQYVSDNSEKGKELLLTQHRTKQLEAEIADLSDDTARFKSFLLSNINSFSTAREKVRYYFCKYLLFFLESKRDRYLKALEAGSGIKEALEELSVFRVRTALSRKKYSVPDARKKIEESGISLGAIYNAFHEFYFEQTDVDWLQVQLECYGDLDSISGKDKADLADSIRRYNRSMAKLSDDEVINWQKEKLEKEESAADEAHREENRGAAYQSGRSGENYLRKVLRGDIDPDRTTLIAFLLFFGSNTDLPEEQRITVPRLNAILAECGFDPLLKSRESDRFFTGFMDAPDPLAFLMEEVEMLAFSEENFYLYKTYLASMSYDRKWSELM
ncbi:MAG: hypothetical protein Q4G47_01050 [Lachnospiraceae bacterium]|nr:hypothetical protein [Lachnospiraceae bacterium]